MTVQQFIPVPDAARRLGCSPTVLYARIRANRLPYQRLSVRNVRIGWPVPPDFHVEAPRGRAVACKRQAAEAPAPALQPPPETTEAPEATALEYLRLSARHLGRIEASLDALQATLAGVRDEMAALRAAWEPTAAPGLPVALVEEGPPEPPVANGTERRGLLGIWR